MPITSLKDFFADRDGPADGGRRKPIMHLMRPHERHMSDGRVVHVGEHLRGERFLEWRGYNLTIGAPGIHFPAIEAYAAPSYDLDGELPTDIPPGDLIPMGQAGAELAPLAWRKEKPRFQKGEPTATYASATIPTERKL